MISTQPQVHPLYITPSIKNATCQYLHYRATKKQQHGNL